MPDWLLNSPSPSNTHLLVPYHLHLQIHYQFPIPDPYSITSFGEKVSPFYDPLVFGGFLGRRIPTHSLYLQYFDLIHRPVCGPLSQHSARQ
jgi:hypothetical protein